MRLWPNRCHQCLTTGNWWHNWPCLRQPLSSSLQPTGFCRKSSMDKRPRTRTLHTCLMFRRLGRARMEQKCPAVEPKLENTERKLQELALKWFTETQAPLILHEGNFPTWFQGFITRKDAEVQLKDKPLGCFLIRLSDKAIGYILSYRGHDRCRHFVINQNKAGQFIVSGDTETHENLTDLIEYYRTSPIEPFGEFLTTSCSESSSAEVYDMVQVRLKERPGAGVEAVQDRPPAVQPRSHGTKLTSPASPDMMDTPPQAAPPVPRRMPLTHDKTSTSQTPIMYAQLEKRQTNQKRQVPLPKEACGASSLSGVRPTTAKPKYPAPSEPGIVYSELKLENGRSKSLPLLDDSVEERRVYRLSTPSFTPPDRSPDTSKKSKDQKHSFVHQRDIRTPANGSDGSEEQGDNFLYHLAGIPRDAQVGHKVSNSHVQSRPDPPPPPIPTRLQDKVEYAEVPHERPPRCFLKDNTYELIPDEGLKSGSLHSNTYELISEQGLKKGASPVFSDQSRLCERPNSSMGSKNDKWRRFFPENKKK
ncbi:hypothetical protein AGOR_G00005830 [Albula goreensis]|uniref:SH2 domain-containing protein n=1 Tax=Albula goreensis TaxID=1534307 RepID=A0A8T3E8E2_9TELE|nr:hypothetical protein AGOR_G00005830 [Albula goreensis]